MADQKNSPPTGVAGVLERGVRPRFGEVKVRDRGHLPHWERDSGFYFVTFRLADSLPREILARIVERNRMLESARRSGLKLTPEQQNLIAAYSPGKIEEYFDRGKGACYLREPRIATLVVDALRFWEGKRYRLLAWCVMPNHVHIVFRLLPGQELAHVVHSWKSYTAKLANNSLGRVGAFWQREYYDRLVRDGEELRRAVQYVISNPERAGLGHWQWVWSAGEDACTTAGLEAGATKSGGTESGAR
jgi:REP element-mobilizing transposase RayT